MSKSLKKSDQNLTDFRNLILLSHSTAHLIPSYSQETSAIYFHCYFQSLKLALKEEPEE